MKVFFRFFKYTLLLLAFSSLPGCDDPQVYGSVGVSSGYSSYGRHGSGSRMHGSITVGGRIR